MRGRTQLRLSVRFEAAVFTEALTAFATSVSIVPFSRFATSLRLGLEESVRSGGLIRHTYSSGKGNIQVCGEANRRSGSVAEAKCRV